ncbi:T-cell immunoglobulin and mucin domain-containing protein 4 isoform X2 [Perca flavescens]|uniref:T-cell immunoglobulin and mucin domain-containing protein 4 isoform X2 n=1 Tax=Perca flavescens TaxID=8167 RepID=UPI00106EFFF6|nr:T-cell immunoglobulin and mucin domain-containing protein 4-like isoform X2 [Perca flavescens]
MMKLVLLLALLTVSECDGSTVVGRTGENVTLACKYDIKYYKALPVCWGRGEIPLSGCGNQIISTDGHKEKNRVSSRYKLLGRLGDGDVSLTILNVTETDAGPYGCRVDIPGWFNDDKHRFILSVERAPQTTTSTTLNETSTEQTAASYTTGQMSLTELLLTSSPSSMKAECFTGEQRWERGSAVCSGWVGNLGYSRRSILHYRKQNEATQRNASAAAAVQQFGPVQLDFVYSAPPQSRFGGGKHLPDRWRG